MHVGDQELALTDLRASLEFRTFPGNKKELQALVLETLNHKSWRNPSRYTLTTFFYT